MYDELVSIVVPVYNAEQFLDRCIISLINQDYENIEVLLINDGSTDSSLQICKKYEIRDKRIVVYDNRNNGVSYTRNYGISKSNGQYISFVDSDDYIERDYISSMISVIKKSGDFTICKYKVFDGKHESDSLEPDIRIHCNVEETKKIVLKRLFAIDSEPFMMGSSCRLLIKKSFIIQNNLTYPLCKIKEDLVFFTSLLLKSKNFRIVNKSLYVYNVANEHSAMNTVYKSNYFADQMICIENLYSVLNNSSIDSKLSQKILNHASWDAYKEIRVNSLMSINKNETKADLINSKEILKYVHYSKRDYANWFCSLPIKSRFVLLTLDMKLYGITRLLKKIMVIIKKIDWHNHHRLA